MFPGYAGYICFPDWTTRGYICIQMYPNVSRCIPNLGVLSAMYCTYRACIAVVLPSGNVSRMYCGVLRLDAWHDTSWIHVSRENCTSTGGKLGENCPPPGTAPVGYELLGRSKGPCHHYWFLSHYLPQSSPTHVCAFILAPAARVISPCRPHPQPPPQIVFTETVTPQFTQPHQRFYGHMWSQPPGKPR